MYVEWDLAISNLGSITLNWINPSTGFVLV